MTRRPRQPRFGPAQDRAANASSGRRFARNGYHFPLRALSADEALRYRRRLEQSEATLGGLLRGSLRSKPHLHSTWANELIRHPAILDAVEDILGPNLLVWSSSFFIKEARDPSYVSWHQDSDVLGVESSRCSDCVDRAVGEHRGERLHARDPRLPPEGPAARTRTPTPRTTC